VEIWSSQSSLKNRAMTREFKLNVKHKSVSPRKLDRTIRTLIDCSAYSAERRSMAVEYPLSRSENGVR
jgi:hypothetical protein